MPSYSYYCTECGFRLELSESLAQARETRQRLRCQHCEGPMQWEFPAPALQTNVEFMRNRDDGYGLDERGRRRGHRRAKAAGINTTGKFWSPQLNAWIGSRDDVRRICRERNLDCDGMVKVEAREVEPPPKKPYQVAPDIVQREVEKITEEHGHEMTSKDLRELPAVTQERLSGRQD